MKPFRFLQLSDVHSDSGLSLIQMGWSRDEAEKRAHEIISLIPEICSIARDADLDAIFIPGDLWNDESISADTAAIFMEAFAGLSPLPIYIAPGNRDFWSRTSLYCNDTLRVRRKGAWSENVFIFQSEHFQTIPHPTRPDVTITGRAFQGNGIITDRFLSHPIPRSEAEIRFLLFHGSLLEYEGMDARLPGKLTAAFSGEELMEQDFSYAALGHFHHYTELFDGQDRIRAAYSGCLAGTSPHEQGPCFALVGEADAGGILGTFEKIQVDQRIVYQVDVDLSNVKPEGMRGFVERKLSDSGALETDIVYVRLKGAVSPGTPIDDIVGQFADRFFHYAVQNLTQPLFPTHPADQRTVEEQVIEQYRGLIERATSHQDEAQFRRSLEYCLQAFRRGTVEPRHED